MQVSSAVSLVNSLTYKPGWKFTAEDDTRRFEGTIRVRIDYPAFRSEREDAPYGYPNEIDTYASFRVMVDDCKNDEDLYRRVFDRIMEIETHEAREFFRIQPTYWAPFHPHRIDGMKRWGKPDSDLLFGVV